VFALSALACAGLTGCAAPGVGELPRKGDSPIIGGKLDTADKGGRVVAAQAGPSCYYPPAPERCSPKTWCFTLTTASPSLSEADGRQRLLHHNQFPKSTLREQAAHRGRGPTSATDGLNPFQGRAVWVPPGDNSVVTDRDVRVALGCRGSVACSGFLQRPIEPSLTLHFAAERGVCQGRGSAHCSSTRPKPAKPRDSHDVTNAKL